MITVSLREYADIVLQRARRDGSVTTEGMQQILSEAGAPEEAWPEVIEICEEELQRPGDHSTCKPALRNNGRRQRNQSLRRMIRALIRCHKQSQKVERRGQDRIDFIQPVRLMTEDGRSFQLLSRDLSPDGIRLIGTRSLLGQKVCVSLGEGENACTLNVRILWTCAVGDSLFENGGMFLEPESDKG